MGHELAFVVGGSAAVDAAIADGWFKGRGAPLVQGFSRLDIIMTVEQDCAAAGEMFVFSNENRVPWCLVKLSVEAERRQSILQPDGAGEGVSAVRGTGRDTGEAQQSEQIVEAGRVHGVEVGIKVKQERSADIHPWELFGPVQALPIVVGQHAEEHCGKELAIQQSHVEG